MSVEQLAAQAWALRANIELQAQARFARLAREVEPFDPSSPVVQLFDAAALEEAHHAQLCDELARSLKGPATLPPAPQPASPKTREGLLCEVFAACCIAETESLATLTLLLSKMPPGRFKEVVHTIARDEVDHAQAGWAHLAREARASNIALLGAQVVTLLDVPSVRALFLPAAPGTDDPALYDYGVVPHTQKRSVFVEVIEQVLVPGLAAHRVDTAPLQTWLSNHQQVS